MLFVGGMLICLEIIVLDHLQKGSAWIFLRVNFPESAVHNVDLHTSQWQMDISCSTSTIAYDQW